jgi:hypothetical protein
MRHREHHPKFYGTWSRNRRVCCDEHLEIALTFFDNFQHLAETPCKQKKSLNGSLLHALYFFMYGIYPTLLGGERTKVFIGTITHNTLRRVVHGTWSPPPWWLSLALGTCAFGFKMMLCVRVGAWLNSLTNWR